MAGRQVGNFPQAFSHVSLVNTACRLTGQEPLTPGQAQVANRIRRLMTENLIGGVGTSSIRATKWGLGGLTRHGLGTLPTVVGAKPRTATGRRRAGRRHAPMWRRRRRPSGRRHDRTQAQDGDDEPKTMIEEEQMKALTVVPLQKGSAELSDVDEPPESRRAGAGRDAGGRHLRHRRRDPLRRVRLGAAGPRAAGARPRVARAACSRHRPARRWPRATSWSGIVRRPDPVPCANCAVGEWDFCRNGQYTERGIKEHDGYLSERTGSRRSTSSRWTRRSGSSASCSSRPAWWPRPGSRSTGSAAGPTGRRPRPWSPGPDRSGCWPR